MRLLISKWPPFIQSHLAGPLRSCLGHVCIPGDPGNLQILTSGLPYCILPVADTRRQPGLLRSLLVATTAQKDRLAFIAPPIVVESYDLTQASFWKWRKELSHFGPLAWVAMPHRAGHLPPWNDCQALVLHGSRPWLLSPETVWLAQAAKRHGKYVHLCNVDTREVLLRAWNLNADSVSLTGQGERKGSVIEVYAQEVQWLNEHAIRQPLSALPPGPQGPQMGCRV